MSGMFPSIFIPTSGYGDRINPQTGLLTFHSGQDYSAPDLAKVGDYVNPGETVGLVGATGNVRINNKNGTLLSESIVSATLGSVTTSTARRTRGKWHSRKPFARRATARLLFATRYSCGDRSPPRGANALRRLQILRLAS